MRTFSIVVAADERRGIGKAGGLPWRLPAEMAYFKRLTSEAAAGQQNAVIMGRATYESIAPKFRPLANRLNVVLSREPSYAPAGALSCTSLGAALALLTPRAELDRIFVIGGASLYTEALRHPACARVYLTRVHATFACDAFLAEFETDYRLEHEDGPHEQGGIRYTFQTYVRSKP
jgi:dihydrofolate reductase